MNTQIARGSDCGYYHTDLESYQQPISALWFVLRNKFNDCLENQEHLLMWNKDSFDFH